MMFSPPEAGKNVKNNVLFSGSLEVNSEKEKFYEIHTT